MTTDNRILRRVGATGLLAAGALHAVWATGSTFPMRTSEDLARAVTGSATMPPRLASAALAAGLLGTGVVVAGAGGGTRTAHLVRVSTGAALLGRGLGGGGVATKLLGLPTPQEPFRTLDRRWFSPLCTVLGLAVLGSARRP